MDGEAWAASSANVSMHDDPSNASLDAPPPEPGAGAAVLLASLAAMTLVTVIGNTLVILAVATTRRLRSVTNCFIVSLSAADLLVGGLVMPLSLVYDTLGVWPFGGAMCELWSSLDVMLCTASILNLCCISLDRYFAITRPLTYTVKRNKRLALAMIAAVWIASAAVTFPPLLGWYERDADDARQCRYVSDAAYVIYSACGSFYIPLGVMLFVYTRIFVVIYRRNRVVKQQKRFQNGHCPTPAKAPPPQYVTSRPDVRSECLVSLEMVSDSLLAIRPRRESGSLKRNIGVGGGGGAAAALFRSRSYQFQFTNGAAAVVSLQRKNPRPDTHLLTVPHWGPAASPPSCGAATGSTGSTFLYPPSIERSKLSLPSLGIQAEQASLLTAAARSRSGGGGDRGCGGGGSGGAAAGQRHRKHARGLRMSFRKETKATTTIAVVVGGFVVCWMPFFLVYIMRPFCASCAFSPLLISGLTWLGWANSAVNPFIYAFYNMDFRAAFWKLTLGHCVHRSPRGGAAVALYPQVWRSRLKGSAVPAVVMVQSDVM